MENDRARDVLFGKLLAYKVALDESLKAHPALPWLAGRLAAAKERGIAVWLGEPLPEATREAFEEAMDEISASLPTRFPD